MTNLEIKKHAARFAEDLAAHAEFLEPEDAWYRWSLARSVSGPAARHLFEKVYQVRMARLAKH